MIGALLLGTSLAVAAAPAQAPRWVVGVNEGATTVAKAIELGGAVPVLVDFNVHRVLVQLKTLPPATEIDRLPPQVRELAHQGLSACRAAVAIPEAQGGSTVTGCADRLGRSLMFTYYRSLGADGLLIGDLRHNDRRKTIDVQLELMMFGRDTKVRHTEVISSKDPTPAIGRMLRSMLKPDARGEKHDLHLDLPVPPMVRSAFLDGPIEHRGRVRIPDRCVRASLRDIALDYPSDLGDALVARWPSRAKPAVSCRLRVHTLPAEDPVALERSAARRVGLACDLVEGQPATVLVKPDTPRLLEELSAGMLQAMCSRRPPDVAPEGTVVQEGEARRPSTLFVVLRGVKGYRKTKQVGSVVEQALGEERLSSRREGADTVLVFSGRTGVDALGRKLDETVTPAGRLKLINADDERLTFEVVAPR